MRRRLIRILLIVLVVVSFVGYFAFSTFLFNPIEGGYAADLSTLVPRNVTFYVSKANLAGDFEADLTPRFAQTAAGQRLAETPEFQKLASDLNLAGLQEQIGAQLEQLPISVDPLQLFGGRDLALAGYTEGSSIEQARWAAYGRIGWSTKLAYSLIGKGAVDLGAQGIQVAAQNGVLSFSGGQLTEPLHTARLRDVLVVSNDLELANQASEFAARKGQESLNQSATYHDEIETRVQSGEEAEVFLRYATLAKSMGWPDDWPSRTSENVAERVLSNVFQLGSLRELRGVADFNGGVDLNLSGGIDGDQLDKTRERLHRRKKIDKRDLALEIARLAPADSGLFAVIEMSIGDLLRSVVDSLEPALVGNLETEIITPIFGYTNIAPFLADLEAALDDRVALIVRDDDYAREAGDPPNNGRPVLAWTLVLWQSDTTLLEELRSKFASNPQRLGLRGAPRESGGYDSGVYSNIVDGGTRVYEYWNELVEGTGHVSTASIGDTFLISNHYKMIGSVVASLVSSGGRSLADEAIYTNSVSAGLDAATLAVWLRPGAIQAKLREQLRIQSEESLESRINWTVERPRIDREILVREFGGAREADLNDADRMRFNDLSDEAVSRFRSQFRSENLPALVQAGEARLNWVGMAEAALLQLRLEKKGLEFHAKLVLPAEQ
jgi:hypothetical protein